MTTSIHASRCSRALSSDIDGSVSRCGAVELWQIGLQNVAKCRATNFPRKDDTEINPTSPTNRELITLGAYRFTRNPMYLGLVIVTLGIAVWVGAWPMSLAPIAIFATANWVHIPYEEAKMRRQFGATYDGYVGRVRRWV